MGTSKPTAASGSGALASHPLGVNPPPSDERPSNHTRPDAARDAAGPARRAPGGDNPTREHRRARS